MAKKRVKVEQGHLEGMEPPTIPEINKAADNYLEARTSRMEMLQDEIKLRGVLELVMQKHNLKVYSYDGKTVQVEAKEKVKVRREKEKEEDGSDDS